MLWRGKDLILPYWTRENINNFTDLIRDIVEFAIDVSRVRNEKEERIVSIFGCIPLLNPWENDVYMNDENKRTWDKSLGSSDDNFNRVWSNVSHLSNRTSSRELGAEPADCFVMVPDAPERVKEQWVIKTVEGSRDVEEDSEYHPPSLEFGVRSSTSWVERLRLQLNCEDEKNSSCSWTLALTNLSKTLWLRTSVKSQPRVPFKFCLRQKMRKGSKF